MDRDEFNSLYPRAEHPVGHYLMDIAERITNDPNWGIINPTPADSAAPRKEPT